MILICCLSLVSNVPYFIVCFRYGGDVANDDHTIGPIHLQSSIYLPDPRQLN